MITSKTKGLLSLYRALVILSALVITLASCGKDQTLKLDRAAATLKVGEQISLIATADPSGEVAWRSEDPTIATVHAGKVTGIKAGQTVIIATIGDASDRCTITVESGQTVISLDKTEIKLRVGEEQKITATTNATEAVQWSSSNSSVCTVNQEGLVKAITSGNAVITAQVGESKAICIVGVANGSVEVRIDPPSIAIPVGIQYQLRCLTNSTQAVSWSTVDASIATVTQDGMVAALKAGQTVIKATVENVEAQCQVTVEAEGDLTFEYIQKEIVLPLKSIFNPTFSPGVFPAKGALRPTGIEYTTDNPEVLKLNYSAAGDLQTLKVGVANITTTYKGHSSTMKVTVVDEATWIAQYRNKIPYHLPQMLWGQNRQTVLAAVKAANPTYKTFSDPSVPTSVSYPIQGQNGAEPQYMKVYVHTFETGNLYNPIVQYLFEEETDRLFLVGLTVGSLSSALSGDLGALEFFQSLGFTKREPTGFKLVSKDGKSMINGNLIGWWKLFYGSISIEPND